MIQNNPAIVTNQSVDHQSRNQFDLFKKTETEYFYGKKLELHRKQINVYPIPNCAITKELKALFDQTVGLACGGLFTTKLIKYILLVHN